MTKSLETELISILRDDTITGQNKTFEICHKYPFRHFYEDKVPTLRITFKSDLDRIASLEKLKKIIKHVNKSKHNLQLLAEYFKQGHFIICNDETNGIEFKILRENNIYIGEWHDIINDDFTEDIFVTDKDSNEDYLLEPISIKNMRSRKVLNLKEIKVFEPNEQVKKFLVVF